jgi:hypothetical protein
MSVAAADMKLKFSVSAATGNSTVGTAAGSLGDQVSTTELTTATIGNLFDDVSGSEASAGDTEYRCIFVCNDHATDTAFNVTLAVQSEVALGAGIAIAVDNIGVTARGSASAQALTIANENTAPSGGAGIGSFGAGPLTIAASMGPLTVAAVWVRRTVTAATAALASDGAVLRIGGEG